MPIFEQIYREIERLIVTGQLKEGDFIPSVREFAMAQQVNPNTVAKAYSELQRSGMVDSQRGKGLYVCRQDDKVLTKKRHEKLSAKISELIQLAKSLGFQKSELVQMITKDFEEAKHGSRTQR